MSTSSNNPWVVIHRFKTDQSILLWSLLTQQSRRFEGEQYLDLKLGDWLKINEQNSQITKIDSASSRVIDGNIQIRAPVVFFSCSKLSKDLGYSPGFGRVACFAKDMNFEKDHIHMMWITYKKYLAGRDLMRQMEKYNVEWVVESQSMESQTIQKLELKVFLQANHLKEMQAVIGIVAEKNAETGSVYNPQHGLCDYKLRQKTNFDVGTFVSFIPMKNFCSMTALDLTKEISLADNICVLSSHPILKLSIKNWKYNYTNETVDVPSWGLTLDYHNSEYSEESHQYDCDQPLTAVFDLEKEQFTLPDGIPMISNRKKTKKQITEEEEYVNFFTALNLVSPVNQNSNEEKKSDADTSKTALEQKYQQKNMVTNNFGYTANFEKNAVVVLISVDSVLLFILQANNSIRKFRMPKFRFKEDPSMGNWFRVRLPDKPNSEIEIIEKLDKPVIKTEVINNYLIKLLTQVNVVKAFENENDRNQVVGYSEDLGAIIDNKFILWDDHLGKSIDVWVLSMTEVNQAHWRIFSEKNNAQKCNFLDEDQIKGSKDAQKSELDSNNPDIFVDAINNDNSTTKLNNLPQDADSATRFSVPNYKKSIEVNAVVVFVCETFIKFFAIRCSLKKRTIKVDISEFGENKKPFYGEWYRIKLDIEKGSRNISGFPLKKNLLESKLNYGKYLLIHTKVRIDNLPKKGSSSSVCGYCENLGCILDKTHCLRPEEEGKVVELWVQNCKEQDGACWCVYCENLKRGSESR